MSDNPQVTEKPIIFSSPMVREIIAGRKTQTRRIVKGRALSFLEKDRFKAEFVPLPENNLCPYGYDRLWVRETFGIENDSEYFGESFRTDGRPVKLVEYPDWKYHLIPHYRATEPEPHIVSGDQGEFDDRTRWQSAIHMPRWVSRLTLEIVELRIERLHDMPDGDIAAEGIDCPIGYLDYDDTRAAARHSFRELWEDINGKGSWERNMWVWVISFKRLPTDVTE
jgi:hypothetical protein